MKFVKLFNKLKRDDVWDNRGERIRRRFRMQLERLKAVVGKYSDEEIMKVIQSDIGYNGLGSQFYSRVISQEALNNPDQLMSKDHYFGAMTIAEVVLKSFKESELDIDYMVDEWLYEHLYLWATVKITRVQHKADNLPRHVHTYEQKLNDEHYQEAGIIITEDI